MTISKVQPLVSQSHPSQIICKLIPYLTRKHDWLWSATVNSCEGYMCRLSAMAEIWLIIGKCTS